MGSGTRDAVAVRHRHGRLSLVMGGPWRAAWRVARVISVALVAAVVTAAMVPAPAAASISGCPEANPTYFDACGPTFTQPAWGDGGGWTDPSKYSTIQLADLNGDGKDELIARNDQGLEIYWFDTSVGQWRPQVDANGVQQVLTDFASPAPGTTPATDWTKPEYYSTIQTAHIDGNAKAQVLARFADGMHVYYFQPGPGGSINGGTWSLISRGGPFSDAAGWNVPSRYETITTGSVTAGAPGTTDLIGRGPGGLVAYAWDGSGWSALPLAQNAANASFNDANCALPSCWQLFRTRALGGAGQTVLGRPGGFPLQLQQYDPGSNSWSSSNIFGQAFSDVPGQGSDCPFPGTSDCLGSSPSYYDTLGAADVNGDGADEVFARAADGLRVKSASLTGGTTYDDQGGGITFAGVWNRAQNVPGAIDGTETSSAQDGRVFFNATPGSVIQVIGPVGPGLGQFAVVLDPRSRQFIFVNQSAPRRREQQVLFQGTVPSTADGEVQLAYGGGGTITIDAIRTYPSLQRVWKPLPTLAALAGPASSVQPGLWGSIRTGDVLGNGRDQVLALDGKGLQIYSYDPGSNAWSEAQPSMPLTLTNEWMTNPAYYSTIRVGDVDGDGRADVVVRGPYGIRTFFYNRRGTGGWESYLPGGYPDFPSRQCPSGVTGPCGQPAAFQDLNTQALTHGAITTGHIRDVWTMNTPDTTTLATLQTNLAGPLVGNCSNETNLAPPTYATCVPPAASSTYNASDWTAVVNEMLSEAYDAEQVVDQFNDLNTIRQRIFESESGTLPAIANELQLAGAAGNTASFNLQGFFGGASGIAASIAGAFEGGAQLSAGLWVASELISMLPSASDTANSSFQTTYAGLLDKFAAAQDEMSDQWSAQLQQVLGDQGLLRLVGQLRSRGTWKLDINGMVGASREAFALHIYQALLPTMYQRYVITNCVDTNTVTCDGTSLPSGAYVTNHTSTSATFLGPADANPCATYYGPVCDYSDEPGTIPDSVAKIVWGPVSSDCTNTPGEPGTVWHYGCSLGVPIATSISADSPGWTFTTQAGNPVVNALGGAGGAARALPGKVRARGPGLSLSGHAPTATAGARAARDVLGPLRFSGRVFLSGELRLRQMRVVMERTLFEHGRREELALSGPNRRLRPFALRHVRGGLFTIRRSGVQVRLNLRRLDVRGGARLDLQLTARTRDVRALCSVLPASVSLDGRPLELETRLQLRDRGLTEPVTLRQRWRCTRDHNGEFTGIAPMQPRPVAARAGLTVRMQPPVAAASGRRAIVLVTVTNRRRSRSGRAVSSLWNLRITGTAGGPRRTVRRRELRAGRSRTIRLALTVPTTARPTVCVRVSAAADSARTDSARRCARVARAAPIAGLGSVRASPAARGWAAVRLALDDLAGAMGATWR